MFIRISLALFFLGSQTYAAHWGGLDYQQCAVYTHLVMMLNSPAAPPGDCAAQSTPPPSPRLTGTLTPEESVTTRHCDAV